MAGIILAGGKGRRLGGVEKALQPLAGKAMLEHVIFRLKPLFSQLILVTNAPELYPSFPGPVVPDLIPNRGPLGGIEAGLAASQEQVNFVTGCDMPFLNQKLVARMTELAKEYDVVIPRIGSFIEPLHSFYSKRALVLIRTQLEAGQNKVSHLLAAPLRVYYYNEEEIRKLDPDLLSFFNVNTPSQLSRAEEILAKEVDNNGAHSFS